MRWNHRYFRAKRPAISRSTRACIRVTATPLTLRRDTCVDSSTALTCDELQ
jgi:hypothetical protein